MLKSSLVFTHAPYSTTQEFDRLMDLYGKKFGVVADHDHAAFYATLLAEVGIKATIKEENLNYSSRALKATFKAFRDNPILADRHGRSKAHKANYEMIGNIAYGGRMGNVKDGDGYLFRGRGFIQLTGRSNYAKVSEVILEVTGIDFMLEEYPEIVGTETGAVMSALGFWKLNNLSGKSIDEVTDRVNNHTDSRGKRRSEFLRIQRIFI